MRRLETSRKTAPSPSSINQIKRKWEVPGVLSWWDAHSSGRSRNLARPMESGRTSFPKVGAALSTPLGHPCLSTAMALRIRPLHSPPEMGRPKWGLGFSSGLATERGAPVLFFYQSLQSLFRTENSRVWFFGHCVQLCSCSFDGLQGFQGNFGMRKLFPIPGGHTITLGCGAAGWSGTSTAATFFFSS